MQKKNNNRLYIFFWILLNLFTFMAVMIEQYTHTAIKSIITKNIWNVIYIILPIMILIMPCIINYFFKIVKRKYILLLIVYIIYICTIIIIHITVSNYITVFTPNKWEEYRYERILMLDDLNIKYELNNMTKDDIKSILGKPDVENINEIEYVVSSGWIDPEMLVFRFEDQKVVEEYTYIEFKSNKLRSYDVS